MAIKRSGRDETHEAVSRTIVNGDRLRLVLTRDGCLRADVAQPVAAVGPYAPGEQPPAEQPSGSPQPDDPQNI